MSQTWSGELTGLAKRLYPDNKIEDLKNMAAVTYGKLTTKKSLGGAGSYLPINTGANESGQGNIAENGTLKTGGKQTVAQAVQTPKVFVHNIQFTGLALSMLKSTPEAFANTFTYHMDEGFKNASKELNAQAFRDGSNVIGYITTLSTTTCACTSGIATHFRPGMVVSIGTTAGTEVTTGTISSVALPTTINGTFSVTFTSAVVCGATSHIWRKGEHTLGLEGLEAIASTSSTFMGIVKSSTPLWQGLQVNAGSVNLSDAMLQRAKGKMLVSRGTKPNCIISNDTQFRMFMLDTLPQVNFEAGKRDSTPNVKYVWNGIEWVVDTDCGFGDVWLVDKSQFYLMENMPLKFDNSDGNIVKIVSGYDSFHCYLKTYANYGTQNCGAFCKIYGLNVPIVA